MEQINKCKLIVFCVIAVCFITGCTQRDKQLLSGFMTDEIEWEILNNRLKDSIQNYIKDVEYSFPEKEYVVGVSCASVGDTACFEISYIINLFSYFENPPFYSTKINGVIVVFQLKLLNYISISKERIHGIYKKSFPKQYSYYLRIGEVPPPNSYSHEHWRLTFVNEKCIKKESFK